MKLKKKKVIIVSSAFTGATLVAAGLGATFYAINPKQTDSLKLASLDANTKILDEINKTEGNRAGPYDLQRDPVKPVEPVVEPTPPPPPVKIVPPEPKPEPEKPEPEPEKPKEPEPEPEKPEPEEPKEPEPEPKPEPPKEPEEPEVPDPLPPIKNEPDPEPEPDPELLPEPPTQPEPAPTPPEIKEDEQPIEKKPGPETELKTDEAATEGSKESLPPLGPNEAYIILAGERVVAKVQKPTPRTIEAKDQHLANDEPYTHNIVSKIESVEVTDELRKANYELGLSGVTRSLAQLNTDVLLHPKTDTFDPVAFARQNWEGSFRDQLYKYSRLFDSDKVVNFLTEEGKKKYPEINAKYPPEPGDIRDASDSKINRYIELIRYLDKSKLKKTTAEVEKFLSEGYEIDPRNVYITENGEITSHAFSPPEANNAVTAIRRHSNLLKRTFGYSSPYGRSGDNIVDGSYPGWRQSDATSEFSKYGASKEDGITVKRLEREEKSPDQINEGIVVTIDAANTKGYQKTLNFIKQALADNVKITSYRILNMGKKDSNQTFYEILSALPNELPQLELFFESTNTSSLLALENKSIKEMSLYTSGNSLLAEWSYNPWSFRHVKWHNTIDYNVSREYDPNTKIYTRISFNSLAFDPKDYNKNSSNPLSRINDGLRMVYLVRNNEPFFQGQGGAGLNPDHQEGGNSYPTGLDLSRIPELRSLKGLNFSFTKGGNSFDRKLKRLVLFSNSDAFEIDVTDLNDAQFNTVLDRSQPQMPKTEILFSNGNATTKVRITNKTNATLTSNGAENLSVLKEYAKSLKQVAQIDPNDTNLVNRIQGLGWTVESPTDNVVFN